ncbi:MAG: NADH-quinone oxidoreductase subunit NuoH [Pseudomonadota bacterium]
MTPLLNELLGYACNIASIGFKALFLMVALLLGVAYLTLAERKVIGYMQLRIGPNTVGPFGLLQPIADGIKLLHKETIIPMAANTFLFLVAPVLLFSLSLAAWAVIPFAPGWVFSNINVGVLYLLAISSLGVYGIIIAGWASNSKYALLGALRSAAQMISYEVSIGLILVSVLLCSGSLNLTNIVFAQQNGWYAVKLFPLFIMFFISCLAETNRTPFDLPEAEAELVAGYHVEYSAFPFALFFLGEYANMILMSAMCTILFAGGWLAPFTHPIIDWIPAVVWFLGKICIFRFIFLWTRATLPRYRYDQLMRLGWKVFLPLSLLGVVIVSLCVMLKGAA